MDTDIQPLAVGDRAPAFTLKTQDGTTVRLRDFEGKKSVVLIFYPGDMTPGCTMQLCAIRDDWSKFQSVDAVVFGVNHADADSHKAFTKKYTFPFELLIDPGKKVSEKYGAMRQYFKVKIIRRSVVVINKRGIITYLRRGMPKNADILKAVEHGNS